MIDDLDRRTIVELPICPTCGLRGLHERTEMCLAALSTELVPLRIAAAATAAIVAEKAAQAARDALEAIAALER